MEGSYIAGTVLAGQVPGCYSYSNTSYFGLKFCSSFCEKWPWVSAILQYVANEEKQTPRDTLWDDSSNTGS